MNCEGEGLPRIPISSLPKRSRAREWRRITNNGSDFHQWSFEILAGALIVPTVIGQDDNESEKRLIGRVQRWGEPSKNEVVDEGSQFADLPIPRRYKRPTPQPYRSVASRN